MQYIQIIIQLLQETVKEWLADDAPRLAAALSYYTAFSIAPLLIVVIAVAGFIFGEEAVRGQIVTQFSAELGQENAEFIQELIQNAARNEDTGIFSTIISILALLVGASGVFAQLQGALNKVWNIEVDGGGIWATIKTRILSFGMILVIGFLLLVSLVISTVIAGFDEFVVTSMPQLQFLMQLVSFVVSYAIISALFAMIYKYLPDAQIEWRDVIVGAIFTALLFNIGRTLLALYLGNTSTTSSYGAAGAFAIILLWVYYSAQIVLFGAEFTQIYARKYGSKIVAEQTTETANETIEPAIPADDLPALKLKPSLGIGTLRTQSQAPEQKTVVVKEKQPYWTATTRVAALVLSLCTAVVGWIVGYKQSE